MKKQELILFLVALALIAAGLTWLFGPYGLLSVGVALLAVVFFIDFKEE